MIDRPSRPRRTRRSRPLLRTGSAALRALLATALVIVLSACATPNRLTPIQCAVVGAGIGAVGGAAGGAEFANENSTAAGVGIGVAGVVGGAALGWGLCRLLQRDTAPESEPQREPVQEPEPLPEPQVEPTPERVTEPEIVPEPPREPAPVLVPVPVPAPKDPEDPCAGTIELPGLPFALGQSVIRLASFDTLDRSIERLIMCPEAHVRIEGHSDSTGSEALNRRLSLTRAEAVRKYLVEAGIDAERVTAAGFGGDRPIDSNDTAQGRSRNRRVEIRFLDPPQE